MRNWIVRASVVAAAGMVASAEASPIFNIVAPGITGPEYVGADGASASSALQYDPSGLILGRSPRVMGAALGNPGGTAAWVFRPSPGGGLTTRVGLFDSQHTKLTGTVQTTWATGMNSAGQATGYSARWFGDVDQGNSAWFFQPTGAGGGSSVRIGLFDNPEHTQNVGPTPGFQDTNAWAISPAGHVIGQSSRFLGGTAGKGFTAWLYTPDAAGGVTVRLGLSGDGYVSTAGPSIGDESSRAEFVSASGQVVGYSARWTGSTPLGSAAWYYRPGSGTVRIGYTDAEHTILTGGNAGTQNSDMYALNDAGAAVGYSKRYIGTIQRGQSLWLYTPENGGTTTRLGFTGGQWVQPSGTGAGQQSSTFFAMNSAGHIVGLSDGYIGPQPFINAAWIYAPGAGGGTTTRMGLMDGAHTQQSGAQMGRQSATIQFLNESGDVAGLSTRFNSTTTNGNGAWFYRNGVTTRIGLFGAGYVDANDTQASQIIAMSAGGRIIGRSNLATGTGATPWLFEPSPSGGTTTSIGPLTSPPGMTLNLPFSLCIALNDSGQVIGTVGRAVGTTSFGDTGWFYDRASNTTTLLIFSTSTDGHSTTTPQILTAQGVVLGTYRLYSGNTDLGDRAFRWTAAEGFQDLGQAVSTGLPANSWAKLTSTTAASPDGLRITGVGFRTGQAAITNGAIYVLIATEPCNLADVGQLGGQIGPDGQLTADDLIVFLSAFFAGTTAIADVTGLGGTTPPDDQLTADDVITYIVAFFEGCP